MRYSQEQKDKVVELRRSGTSFKEIEEQTGVKADNIRYICKKFDIKVYNNYTEEQKQEALELRKSGLSPEDIESKTGIRAGTVRSWCLDAGIKFTVDYTDEQRTRVIQLRKDGISLKDIEAQTGVKQGTIRFWCGKEGVILTRDQHNANMKHPELLVKEQEVIDLRVTGTPISKIADTLNVSRSYVKRLQKKNNIEIPPEIKAANVQAGRHQYTDQAREKFFSNLKLNNGESLDEYKNSFSKINIKCDKGHIFESKPQWINNGQWCQRCHFEYLSGVNSPIAQKRLKEMGYSNHLEWCQAVAKERDGECLSTESVTTHTKVKWQCNKGENHVWEASLGSIINCDSWCPFCTHRISKGQNDVADYIESLLPGEEVILNESGILTKEAMDSDIYSKAVDLDIWVPSRNFAIEYNGLYWHSSANARFKEGKEQLKALTCHKLGINFLMVYEDEWQSKPELIKAMIRQRLGISWAKKVFARKLELRYLEKNKDWEPFFERNHLDGSTNASFGYGLFDGDCMLMCATVRKNFNGELELARLATDYDYLVPGGASRLIKAIKDNIKVPLITFSNNRLSSGEVYRQMGGENITEKSSRPSYYYTDGNTRIWRFKCRRNNDPSILAQYPTEREQALNGVFSQKIFGDNRALYKIEDAGHQKWIIK